MLLLSLLLSLSCVPLPNTYCTRELSPVCADGVTYSNACLARAAGFHSDCASLVLPGECSSSPADACPPSRPFFSETQVCVPKPWSDFAGCAVEKAQGACPGGSDPNPWVGEHCAITCAAAPH